VFCNGFLLPYSELGRKGGKEKNKKKKEGEKKETKSNFNYFVFLQTYLADKEFEEVFSVTKPEFEAYPLWKKEGLKKDLGLF
jgi:hypothetical protein